MSWLRTLMLLALIVWIGGIIFFSFVVAPTVFTVLPIRELAGNVVSRSLTALHWMGLISGLVFLLCSVIYNQKKHADARLLSATHVLMVVMLGLTAISQFGITPRMRALRSEMGVIDQVPVHDARRIEFNHLHEWSTRAEGSVLLCGLAVVVLTARRESK
jgi:phosphoglycerol transferase MdoB-like AlkP superfamily enzyme